MHASESTHQHRSEFQGPLRMMAEPLSFSLVTHIDYNRIYHKEKELMGGVKFKMLIASKIPQSI